MSTFIDKVLRVVLRLIGQSREAVGSKISTVDVISAYARHFFRSRGQKGNSRLVAPNDTILFPLPDRWTNTPNSLSFQPIYLFAMQATYSGVDANMEKSDTINRAQDKSLANLELMENLRFTSITDTQTLKNIASIFEDDTAYSHKKEILVGQSIVNGENPFLLRKFNGRVEEYEVMGSADIESAYKKAFKESFKLETLNENTLREAGLTAEVIRQEIQSGENLYSMLFEHLEQLSKGKPIEHTPTILFGNSEIQDTYYLQTPYPVFLNLKPFKMHGWICIGVAYRYKGTDVKVFSPFFQSQGYDVWKLATSQLLQGYFNDFHIRVHLGLMHLTTNQYNVPIYNSLNRISKSSDAYKRLHTFLTNAYTLFNEGLQGVNLTATATLINKIEEYSIINRVFNISQVNALTLMANYSNNLDITRINPETFITKNGLKKPEVETHFDEMKLAIKLNSIISGYIDKLDKLLLQQDDKALLFQEINMETPNMGVGNRSQQRERHHRSGLTNRQDVITLIKNLAFCWCVYHAQTFTTMPYAEYWQFRPTMLKKAVPTSPAEWARLQPGEELPQPKIMMSTSQLIGGVSGKDPNNFLIQIMYRRYLEAQAKVQEATDPRQRQLYSSLQKIYLETFEQLSGYGREVDKINHSRLANGLTPLSWMHPSVLEASLNI